MAQASVVIVEGTDRGIVPHNILVFDMPVGTSASWAQARVAKPGLQVTLSTFSVEYIVHKVATSREGHFPVMLSPLIGYQALQKKLQLRNHTRLS